jgi:hypothetical protein
MKRVVLFLVLVVGSFGLAGPSEVTDPGTNNVPVEEQSR